MESQLCRLVGNTVWWRIECNPVAVRLIVANCYTPYLYLYLQGGPQKLAQFLYALTLSDISRFSKLFHCQNYEKICNTVTKDPTTPQVCCYTTLWNVIDWGKLSQRFIDLAIRQWRRRLECVVQQQVGHIEDLMYKKLCYCRGTSRRACQYKSYNYKTSYLKIIAIDKWPWRLYA